ncbi:MAG: hypothetical protein LBC02_00075 [Planctomycetaceae bacterium]|nr:hypothetical protein [Planctomycetaceae bacterium]
MQRRETATEYHSLTGATRFVDKLFPPTKVVYYMFQYVILNHTRDSTRGAPLAGDTQLC